MKYPRRLIEVDLPIKRISAHARREKSIRHGHISTLHLWWARRPLAACRAVLCAALWPDPADPLCPPRFVEVARDQMLTWVKRHVGLLSSDSASDFIRWQRAPSSLDSSEELQKALLHFIADFANWDNSAQPQYLATCHALTSAAHEALGGEPDSRPLVVDSFAGGGSIPLEALRIGADAFASDSNPVAVVLNKVVLEYIPRFGQRLADEVRKWGAAIKADVEQELQVYYPADRDGAVPVAYLWARTIRCEGPGCGAEVPLIRSLWLCKTPQKNVALKLVPRPSAKRIDFELLLEVKAADVGPGTVKLGSATCPLPACGYTTKKKQVREQLMKRCGGAEDARLLAVVTTRPGTTGKHYRLPTARDLESTCATTDAWHALLKNATAEVPDSDVPEERVWKNQPIRIHLYGMKKWRDIFTPRQGLALEALARHARAVRLAKGDERDGLGVAVRTCLALAVSRQTDYASSLSSWNITREGLRSTFSRQAISMIWDFAEACTLADSSGGFTGALEWVARVCESSFSTPGHAEVIQSDARSHVLPDHSVQLFATDPPYYDAVPYAAVADFFYVWLRTMLGRGMPTEFSGRLIDKSCELVLDDAKKKDRAYFEHGMTEALAEGARILTLSGLSVIVFAHLSTDGWEAMLGAVIAAGLTITASWPIDTERGSRPRAINSAALASSVHLVCRPRVAEEVGDWRSVLRELPARIHAWMPRLAAEGVVGADAIFACLGPALEAFSRWSRVEKASGEQVLLKEYLEHVWAAVAREALNMIFAGADATGLEEDARLTAMWLWTLSTTNGKHTETADDDEVEADDEEETPKSKKPVGYFLEYDAARKIAQGLGAHLETLTSLVEVKGDSARLIPVLERSKHLLSAAPQPAQRRTTRTTQLSLLGSEPEEHVATGDGPISQGRTVLDRIHQSMLLFSHGRSDALKRFLVEEGAGTEARFWTLAQSLSALYPKASDEKRWVDGVLARKKALGL